MKISFLGATGTVTGSCYLLEHENTKFLVDCGMFQGGKALKELNYNDFPFNPTDIDFVLLTHAHIDHSGLLPKLVKLGFSGRIYTTNTSADLLEAMLPDSAHIQESEVERKNRKLERAGKELLEPIYTQNDALETLRLLQSFHYDEKFEPANHIWVNFHDAGHILGSAIVEIDYFENGEAKKMVFSGDLGSYDAAIVNDPATIAYADYVVMETTYGNRLHAPIKQTAHEKMMFLAATCQDTFNKGGNVIIPAFAVDRCQDLLLEFNAIIEEGLLKNCKIYVDSPLAVKATEIFDAHPECFDQETLDMIQKYGHSPFKNDNIVFSRTLEESMAINNIRSGAIIISASGMADAGRIKHHLKHNLWRPECTVIFAGYQGQGTLGRRLVEGEKIVRIHGEKIEVRANIITLKGYSAHGDSDELCRWLSEYEKMPQNIFLIHGEDDARATFAQTVSEKFGIIPEIPELGETFDLSMAKTVVEPQKIMQKIEADTPAGLFMDINFQVSQIAQNRDIDKLNKIKEFLKTLA